MLASLLMALCTFLWVQRADAQPTRKTLASGLRVVIEQRPHMGAAVVSMSYQAGTDDEPRSQAGLADLTRALTTVADGKAGEARRQLDARGALVEESTTADLTSFVTIGAEQHLGLVLWFEALRMATLDVSADTFTKVRAAMEQELAEERRHDLFGAATDMVSGIALERPPRAASLTQLGRDDARLFHRTFYTPSRAALVVVSSLDPASVLQLVETTLGAVHRTSSPVSAPPPAAQTTRRHSSFRSLGAHRAGVAFAWRVPAPGHADEAALRVAAEVLAGDLHDELVTKKGVAFSARAMVRPSSRGGLMVALVDGPRHALPMDLAAAVQQVGSQVGLDPALVAAARARLKRRIVGAHVSEHARWLGELELTGARTSVADIDAVSDDDIRRVVRTYLVDEGASVVECFPAPIILNEADQAAHEAQQKAARERAAEEAKKEAAKKRRPKAAPRKRKSTKKRPTKPAPTKKRAPKRGSKQRKKKR